MSYAQKPALPQKRSMELGSSFNDKEHPDKTNGSIWPFEFSRLLELQLLLSLETQNQNKTEFSVKKDVEKISIEKIMTSMLWATTAASFLGFAYVGGLYVWRTELDRDHPETIKRRFLSAFFTSCLCPPLVYIFGDPGLLSNHSLAEVIGIRRPGLEAAVVVPLGLTMILFLGPIGMLVSNDRFRWLVHPSYWSQCLGDWIWWRNQVVAPFTEEFAFRYSY
jgi:hypothetical protein